MSTADRRAELCKGRGLRDEAEVYQIVAEAGRTGVQKLIVKRLTAPVLKELGYSEQGMRKLGFSDEGLAQLGYSVAVGATQADSHAMPADLSADVSESEKLRALLKQGWRAEQFRQNGVTLHHLKRASCQLQDLLRAGFQMDEFVALYSCGDLKRAGFNIRELRRYFRGDELRSAGFDATDMRNAGYGIRELLNFGFNENQVKIAGYSINELAREGLTRQTVDRTKRG
jgi:intracellular multiplication protein IcmE